MTIKVLCRNNSLHFIFNLTTNNSCVTLTSLWTQLVNKLSISCDDAVYLKDFFLFLQFVLCKDIRRHTGGPVFPLTLAGIVMIKECFLTPPNLPNSFTQLHKYIARTMFPKMSRQPSKTTAISNQSISSKPPQNILGTSYTS